MPEARKIVVIHPPQEVENDFIDYPYFTGFPAMSLAEALKLQGHHVHLLDAFARPGAGFHPLRGDKAMFGVPFAALVEPLKDADFDWAIVHFTTFALRGGFSQGLAFLLSRLRELRPHSRVIGAELYAGGMHRIEPDGEMLQSLYTQLDAFVSLEGEETIPELVASDEIEGFLVEGTPISADTLEKITPPGRDPAAREAFVTFLAGIKGLPKVSQYRIDEATLPVYFSRGCPFSCSFCSNPYQDYRAVSMATVDAILERAVEQGFNRLFVLDDAANVRKDFSTLLERVADGGLRLEFPNGLRADLLTRDQVELLTRVTDTLTISAESASSRLQVETLGKSVSPAHVERVAEWCSEAGLKLYVHWMVALPGETREETSATLESARKLLDESGAGPLVQYATPIPGTAMAASSPAVGAALGPRMQHFPSYLPESVSRTELADAVRLLRQRAREARTRKVIINITYRCNNHCLFCAVGNRIQEDLPFDYIQEVLERYRSEGVGQLDLDGGEPTLHPRLFDIVKLASRLGYHPINITTNARRLAYPDFARRVLNSGVTSILVSIHGPNTSVHEQITGVPGSFMETMDGIRNALAYRPGSVDLGINTTLSTHNYTLVEQLVEILYPLGMERFNIQFLTPFGRAAAEVVPDPAEAAGVVRSVIDKWKDRVRFQVINLPYCYLQGLEEFVAQDLGKLSRNMVFVTKQEVNLYEYLASTRAYDDSCAGCLYRVACDGKYDFSEVLD